MVLDIICTCGRKNLRIGYNGYFQLRCALARLYGFDFEAMTKGDPALELRCYEQQPLLHQFICHPDHTGTWTAEECAEMLPFLRAVVAQPALATHGPQSMMIKKHADGTMEASLLPPTRTFKSIIEELIKGFEHCMAEGHVLQYS